MYCSTDTSLEEIELHFRRFFDARKFGQEEFLFILADVHCLSYGTQCATVDAITELKRSYGTKDSATLLLLSGKPNIMLLNALSAHMVQIQLTPPHELIQWCENAFSSHLGETVAVVSEVNGGGKTHYIRKKVAQIQASKAEGHVDYFRVPFREESNATNLLLQLQSAHYQHGVAYAETSIAFHLDIRHIIPTCANTVLFQLLMIGILRDNSPGTSIRVYYRRPRDIFFLEVANSPGNKTAEALRFVSR